MALEIVSLGAALGISFATYYLISRKEERALEVPSELQKILFREENIKSLEKIVLERARSYNELLLNSQNVQVPPQTGFELENSVGLFYENLKPRLEDVFKAEIEPVPVVTSRGYLNSFLSKVFLLEAAWFFLNSQAVETFFLAMGWAYLTVSDEIAPSKAIRAGSEGLIVLGREKDSPQGCAATLVHEFAHIYFSKKEIPLVIEEGLCRYLEVLVSEQAYKETNDPYWALESVRLELGELKGIYLEACKKFGRKPDPKIERIEVPAFHKYFSIIGRKLTPHAVGIALVRLGEKSKKIREEAGIPALSIWD